jgi:hypothetical protein
MQLLAARLRRKLLQPCLLVDACSGSVRDTKPCPRWRQLSPKAGIVGRPKIAPSRWTPKSK